MLIVGTLNITSLPLAYVFMLLGYDAGWVLVAKIIMDLLTYIYRIGYLKVHIGMDVRKYIKNVVQPITLVALASLALFYSLHFVLVTSLIMLVVNVSISVIVMTFFCFCFGLSKMERAYCINFIKNKIHG